MSKDVYRRETWYEGHVQGVGFRANVISVACGYAVTGTVRNLPDGRVFLVAEGDAAEVAAFLEEVRRQLNPFIRKEDFSESNGVARYRGFTLSF